MVQEYQIWSLSLLGYKNRLHEEIKYKNIIMKNKKKCYKL